MIKKILVGLVFSCCVEGVYAQPPTLSGAPAGIDRQTMDVLPSGNQHRLMGTSANAPVMTATGSGVTVDTVGDPYSFGNKMIYLGVAQTEWLTFQADCSGFPPDSGQCIQTTPTFPGSVTGHTSGTWPDLAEIQLPGKSTDTIICFTFTPFAQWAWSNDTGTPQMAAMNLRPTVRIESDVLNDPSLIDPTTGNPFNGVLLDGAITTFVQTRTLSPGESDSQYNVTTRSCTGGLVNQVALSQTYGLSDTVIKNFFKNPITIKFGVSGSISMVTDASYSVGIRLFGD